MSKPMVIRQENVFEMINEIHESMTNVYTSGAYTVASIIMDSIHEDAIWVGTQSDVKFGEIECMVQMWIDEQAEEAEQMSAEQLEVIVTSYDDMAKTIGTDTAIAMAMTFRKYAGK